LVKRIFQGASNSEKCRKKRKVKKMVTPFVEPDNKILINGDPVVYEYKATDAAIKPGDLVQFKTSSVEIDEGGAPTGTNAMGLGVAGYEQASDVYKPTTRVTAYADDAMIPVIMVGSGAILMAAVTGVLARGAALTGQASAGELATATIGTNHIYGILLDARAVDTASLDPVILL